MWRVGVNLKFFFQQSKVFFQCLLYPMWSQYTVTSLCLKRRLPPLFKPAQRVFPKVIHQMLCRPADSWMKARLMQKQWQFGFLRRCPNHFAREIGTGYEKIPAYPCFIWFHIAWSWSIFRSQNHRNPMESRSDDTNSGIDSLPTHCWLIADSLPTHWCHCMTQCTCRWAVLLNGCRSCGWLRYGAVACTAGVPLTAGHLRVLFLPFLAISCLWQYVFHTSTI